MRKSDKLWKTRSDNDKQEKYVDTALMVRLCKDVLEKNGIFFITLVFIQRYHSQLI